jgi:hypothetical protein
MRSLQVVQEIKVLRSSVSQREKERAERATLVQQERLIKAKVRAALSFLCLQNLHLHLPIPHHHHCMPKYSFQSCIARQ